MNDKNDINQDINDLNKEEKKSVINTTYKTSTIKNVAEVNTQQPMISFPFNSTEYNSTNFKPEKSSSTFSILK